MGTDPEDEQYRTRYERTLRLASALAELTPLAAARGSIPAIATAIRTLISRATDVLEVGLGGIWRYDEPGHRLVCHLHYDRAVRAWSADQVVAGATAPNYLRALLSAEAVPAHDAVTDPRTSDLAASYLVPQDIGALLDARMLVNGIFGGVVCFEHVGATRRWQQEEIRFAIGIAGLAGVLLERHDSAFAATRTANSGLQFDELYTEAPFGVVTFDLGGKIRRVNPRVLDMFGVTGVITGKPLAALFGDGHDPDLTNLRARLTKGAVHVEHAHNERSFSLTYIAMGAATGVPQFIACIASDLSAVAAIGAIEPKATAVEITRALAAGGPTTSDTATTKAFAQVIALAEERDRAKKDADEQATFLRHIADNIREVFWLATWPGRDFLYATPSIEAISGRSVGEIMTSGRQLRDLVHPADVGELAKQVAEGRERFDLLHRALRPDGTIRWIQTHAFFIKDDAGKPIRLAGVSEDVTEQTEADKARRVAEARVVQLVADGDREVARLSAKLGGEGQRLGGLLGNSAIMRDVFRRIRQAAEVDVTVLITGESGTGKELAAAAIHEHGARRGKPFVALNCAAIPETLLESELFGYTKGAFTGASRDKVGLMQAAHGGTLFLDEIGDMTASLQVKMLRALQQREIRRLGDDRAIPIDIRLVSATHRDLRAAVASGAVREDFFYRIRVFEIDMPPLRARAEDIPLLASHFATELGRLANKPAIMISQDAMRRLCEYDFPGNVRELRNAIERAIVGAERSTIGVHDLPLEMRGDQTDEVVITPVDDQKRTIAEALEATGGNRTEAARMLGISRVTLWKRMRKLGMATDDD